MNYNKMIKNIFILFITVLFAGCATYIGPIDGSGCRGPDMCIVHIYKLNADGGTIYVDTTFASEDKVAYLANENCNLRGKGSARLGTPYKHLDNSVRFYDYQCQSLKQETVVPSVIYNPVHQVIGDVPSKPGLVVGQWTGNERFSSPAGFIRKPLDPGSVEIRTERGMNTDFHGGIVSDVLQIINGTPTGQEVLERLRDAAGGAPIFIASANESFFEGGNTKMARAVEVTGGEDGRGSAIVYINTPLISRIFAGPIKGVLPPAKLMRQIVMEVTRASQLMGRTAAGKSGDVWRQYTDGLWAVYEGDKFFGELNAKHGDTFTHLLGTEMHEGNFPGLTDRSLLSMMEQVPQDLRVQYLRALRDADNLPSGVRLGLELFDSGGGRQTPIRVALNVFDERHEWSALDLLNKHLPEGLQNDGNSIVLIDEILYRLKEDPSEGAFPSFAKAYLHHISKYPKVGRQELAIRVTQEIKRLVDTGAYTRQDVAELIAGLKFPAGLQKFFDNLLGDMTPSKPKNGPS